MSKDQIQFFFDGDEYYKSLWCDLLAAKKSIFIEMYILKSDAIGDNLLQILVSKAKSGVAIKIICDGLGSLELPKAYIDTLKAAGVELKLHHPFSWFKLYKPSTNRRNHRKVVLIDNEVGYIGGFNFHAECSRQYFGEKNWRDTMVRITGDWVDQLTYAVKRSFGLLRFFSRRIERASEMNRVVTNVSRYRQNRIRRLFHRYIRRSHRLISITSAYFVPDITTIFLLTRAVKRGVKVRIITSRDCIDVPQVNRVNRGILKFLIKRGVEIYCFKDRVLHAKTAFFDGKIGTVGSTNFNYRSFFWDLEINAFFSKQSWVKHLQEQESVDLKECRLITYEEVDQVSWWNKLIDNFFYLIKGYF